MRIVSVEGNVFAHLIRFDKFLTAYDIAIRIELMNGCANIYLISAVINIKCRLTVSLNIGILYLRDIKVVSIAADPGKNRIVAILIRNQAVSLAVTSFRFIKAIAAVKLLYVAIDGKRSVRKRIKPNCNLNIVIGHHAISRA